MVSKVEIINNPYARRVKILINGNAPSAFSVLDKFMSEPFLYWYNRIFAALYQELNGGSFALHFTSCREETAILEKLARDCEYCVQFSSSEITRRTPLTERLSALSRLIKQNGITGFRYCTVRAVFIVPDREKALKAEIAGIEIRNQFCKVDSQAVSFSDYLRSRETGDVMFLVCPKTESESYLQKTGLTDGFMLLLSKDNCFCGNVNGLLAYETTPEHFFDTVFQCLILGPLSNTLWTCISSLTPDVRQRFQEQLDVIQSTSARVLLRPESTTVEKGCSIRIKFESDMDGYGIDERDLEFSYSENGIIQCNGQRIDGLKDGKCTLYVYRRGEKDPCAQMQFTVITRNRVTDLSIEEQGIELGEGDSLKLTSQYTPVDADNLNQMQWSSDDTAIAVVSQSGVVRAARAGDTRIRLTCGNVSAKTVVRVLPHIKGIKMDCREYWMQPGETVSLEVSTVPPVVIEGKCKMSTMDARIANAVNGKLQALAPGVTELVVQDRMERIREKAVIHVLTEKEWKKREKQLRKSGPAAEKNGLLTRLLGNK